VINTVNGLQYAMFDLSSANVNLVGTRTLELRADIVNGTGKNFTVGLGQGVDMVVRDPLVFVNILLTDSAGDPLVSNFAGTFTIN
jgi:hypothetical protein